MASGPGRGGLLEVASAKPHWPSPQQLSTPGMDGARAEVQLALPGGLVVGSGLGAGLGTVLSK